MTTPRPILVCLLLAAFSPALLPGCTAFKQKVAPLPPAEHTQPPPPTRAYSSKAFPTAHYRNIRCYVHRVRWPDESLKTIAQWYTGSGANWKILVRSTPNLRANRLHQGDVVFIPADLLQIETPMPQQYVQQHHPAAASPADRTRSQPDPAVRPDGPDPQPQPYGPRPYPKSDDQ
ncbi:MAG: hypothetical protein JJV98_07090 [Desulfosarcina sp.]|nr:hypothetical protein [Desulfobacterales bacterium]